MFNTSLNNGGSEKVGTIKAFGGSVAPFGWLICDGSAISRTLYAALFDVIGETYGAGDGTTTFNLPNGKAVIGTEAPALGTGSTLGVTKTDGTTGQIVSGNLNGYYPLFCNKTPVEITIDSSKSGIITDLTKANAASLAIIKY